MVAVFGWWGVNERPHVISSLRHASTRSNATGGVSVPVRAKGVHTCFKQAIFQSIAKMRSRWAKDVTNVTDSADTLPDKHGTELRQGARQCASLRKPLPTACGERNWTAIANEPIVLLAF